MKYRKIGGIHWLSIGRLRISWCIKRRQEYLHLPSTRLYEMMREVNAQRARSFTTHTNEEHNHFIF